MFKGQIPVAMSGNRKATSRWCPGHERWEDTPRGLVPMACRLAEAPRRRRVRPMTARPAETRMPFRVTGTGLEVR